MNHAARQQLNDWDRENGVLGEHRRDADDLPPSWTRDHLAKRLVETADIYDRVHVRIGPKEPGNNWVQYSYEFSDRRNWEELPEKEKRARYPKLDRPTPQDLHRADLCRTWMQELRERNAHWGDVLANWVVCRCRNNPVTELCKERGWAQNTFYRWRDAALQSIVDRLNRTAVPVF